MKFQNFKDKGKILEERDRVVDREREKGSKGGRDHLQKGEAS